MLLYLAGETNLTGTRFDVLVYGFEALMLSVSRLPMHVCCQHFNAHASRFAQSVRSVLSFPRTMVQSTPTFDVARDTHRGTSVACVLQPRIGRNE